MRYQKFDPIAMARRSLNYLTGMVDENNDHLPYWLILPNKKPAEAAHCRVDDAELVGSWYEGLDSSMHVLNTQEGSDVLDSFRRFLMSSWGEHGLRFHNKYPWTHTMHSSFHEMGYILPALNRLSEKYPDDEEIEERISGLIKGLRSLVIERKVRTFWSGDMNEPEPIYEFPNDVYLQDGGFDLTRHTGRGEQAIRNSIMLHSLVRRYEIRKDETALDLACGIANYVLGPSRYFSWDMNFFGHVHSAMWFASGLVRLGRVIGRDEYIQKARGIYAYVRSISSSFGWVPEYARWHPMDEEHCESCCIKDMIECAFELIDCGYGEYWTDVVLFSRNQLAENQISYSGYVTDDNSRADGNGITYKNISSRMIGGYTGGSLPNSISLSKFRSIAGCCAGIAPVGLAMVWDRAVTEKDGTLCVNIPLDKQTDDYMLESAYPERGNMALTAKRDAVVCFRMYPFMKGNIKVYVDGKETDFETRDGLISVGRVKAGQKVTLSHPIRSVPQNLMTDARKRAVALFISEVLYHTLRYPMTDERMFDFLANAVRALDETEEPQNFHLRFLIDFAAMLGFGMESSQQSAISPQLSAVGHPLTRKERQEALRTLCTYFEQHVETWQNPRSLEVLIEVFD